MFITLPLVKCGSTVSLEPSKRMDVWTTQREYSILRIKAACSLSKMILVTSSQFIAFSQFAILPGLHIKRRNLFYSRPNLSFVLECVVGM